MTVQAEQRVYIRVRELVESLGGSMRYLPGGGPGGVWELNVRGRTSRVEVRDNRVNALDKLYVPKVPNPITWDDYDPGAPLFDDAFWRILELFPEPGNEEGR